MKLKQTMAYVSPPAFRLIERIYRSSPIGQRAQASANIHMERLIADRCGREATIFAQYLGTEISLLGGPFAGMKYVSKSAGSVLGPKIIGSYEFEIQPWIKRALSRKYENVIDIGAAEGYYAVGFARAEFDVIAYDTDKKALGVLEELANINDVRQRISIRGICGIDSLRRDLTPFSLIICDIEGAELDLLRPDLIPELAHAEIIVEAHDDHSPGITATLVERFRASHRIEIVSVAPRRPKDFESLARFPTDVRQALLDESRPRHQSWLNLVPSETIS